MIQSSDNSQRIIIGANVYDSPTGSWQRFTADSAALAKLMFMVRVVVLL